MPRVTHFEINADDPERAARFYTTALGWEIEKWSGPIDYWLVATGKDTEPGINGAIQKRASPEMTTVNTVEVASLDEVMEKILAAGGKITQPRTIIPGAGYLAYFLDTEGNPFGAIQIDPNAG